MKYQVKIQYTNPSHEHVSLRRRVESVTRLVEAANEQEAINRAANQQRALGFKIQEAVVVEQEKKPLKTEQLTEASKEGQSVMRGMRASLKLMDIRHGVDADKRDAGYKKSPAVAAAQAKSDELSKVVKRPQAGTLAAAKLRKEEVEYIEEKLTASDPASKWIADFVKSDNPKFAGKSKKERINQALGAYYAAKRGKVEEGFDPSPAEIAKMLVKKHGAGNVTKQHILDLESDRDSFKGLDHDEVMKHVQKMSEEVEQTEEAVRVVDRFYPGVPHDPQKRKDVAATVKKIRKDPDARGGMTGFNRYQDFFGGGKARLGAERTRVGEEVEQVEEGVATAQKVMNRAKVVANTNPDPKKRFAASGLAQKAMLRTINPTGVNTGITRGGGNKTYRMLGKIPPYQLTKKTGVSEEVEQIDELKKSTLASYVKKKHDQYHKNRMIAKTQKQVDWLQKDANKNLARAEKRLDAVKTEEVEQVDEANMRFDPEAAARPKSSDVKNFLNRDKNPRAAAASKKYIRRMTKLGGLGPNQTKKDTEAHMKAHFEEVNEANTRVVNKEVKKEKAAETAVAAARRAKNSKNKVETEPRLDMDVGSSEKKYVTKV